MNKLTVNKIMRIASFDFFFSISPVTPPRQVAIFDKQMVKLKFSNSWYYDFCQTPY